MKIDLIQFATVVLITGTALAQGGQPLTGTTSSTSPVTATPVQINPKVKPASPSTANATTPDKNKASSTKSATTAKPVLTIKPPPRQSAAKGAPTKAASPSQKAANSTPVSSASTSTKAAARSTKPATGTVQGGKAVAVQSTKAPAKPTTATAQPSAKTPSASTASKTTQAGSASKTNGAANQKPAVTGIAAQKSGTPTAPKTSVAQKPASVAKSTQLAKKPGSSVAAKPIKTAPSAIAAKKQQQAGPKAKISAVEQPVKPAATAPEEAAAPAPKRIERAGRRDPFISPIHTTGAGVASSCTTGKRCLDIEQVVLKGIVMTREGNMALVENAARRPYVLRENDSLFNGIVEKITGDSVMFRQNVQDVLGHTSTRQVVKRVTAPAV